MTVCVGVKVRDCIVFAADSAVSMMATTSGGDPMVQNIWNHGIKVHNLHKEHPIVAMSAGAGNLGSASLSELVKYLRRELTQGKAKIKDGYTIEEVAKQTSLFLSQFVSNESLDFMVGGYGAGAAFGEVWKFAFDDGNLVGPTVVVSAGVPSYVFWAGSGGRALHRLVLGRDEAMPVRLEQAGVEKKVIEAVEQDVYVPLIDPAMPVQDAINLATFLVDVAKGFCAFAPGMNVVGGETDIATVTRHEGFKWIRRKHYYDAAINRLETDHG